MISIRQLMDNLNSGVYDQKLASIYCRPVAQIAPYRDRILHIVKGYAKTLDKEEDAQVAIFSAPGRTEIGGNHTDHQRGKVLTGAVDLDAIACAAPNGTSIVNIFSEGYGVISVDSKQLDILPEEKNTTAALVRGVLAGFSDIGYAVSGFDAYMISDVPGGSGLSSSACFEVLIGVIVNGLFCGNKLTMPAIAKIGQHAENLFFGKPSGLLDQMGCAMGGIIAIDFQDKSNPAYKAVNFDFTSTGYVLCIVDTGADHSDLTGYYADVPSEMRAVAAEMGKEVLCEVDELAFIEAVPQLRKKLGDRAILRAIHYFTDCHRVDKQVAALESGDFEQFLRLVSSSGHSSYMYLQNVATYRDPADQPVAVALAMAGHYLKGTGARRVHGGGFAGTIQAYVPLDLLPEFKAGMDALIGNDACQVTYIRPVGGCTLIE